MFFGNCLRRGGCEPLAVPRLTLWAPAKPPGETEPLTSGRQHFVFEASAKKANQSATKRGDIDVALAHVQAQRSFISGQPGFVQVESTGQQAASVSWGLVQVPTICAAGGITGKVALELEEAQLQLAVERQSQRFEMRQAIPLGMGGTLLFQPQHFVPSQLWVVSMQRARPYPSRVEPPCVPFATRLLSQSLRKCRGYEAVLHTPTVFAQLGHNVSCRIEHRGGLRR
jgi:hypothetical protein